MTWQTAKSRQQLDRETGTIFKDWGGRLPIALVYPNSYHIGMSNLGLHAVYSFLNRYPDIVCERVFIEPRQPGAALSVESGRPLADFAVIAFSLTYELDYFNIVPALRKAGVPLLAAERDAAQPLLIAGGPCVIANPLPLAPLFDAFGIGEAEAILPALLPVLQAGAGGDRAELLARLASLPGVYVPARKPEKPVVRQWVRNLDDFPTHSAILTPDTELGDRYLVEVERGCKWGCRFCLVGTAYRPVRFHSLASLLDQAQAGLQRTRRLGLVGPSLADHPRFDELIDQLAGQGAEISVSSLRIKPLSRLLLANMVRHGSQSVALAPEAGSEKLRRVICKGVDEDDILAAMHVVGEMGFRQLKLYFMVGLPTEMDDDIRELIELSVKCKAILDSYRGGCQVSLTIAPFVPKAGTPFQWLAMESPDVLARRLGLIRSALPPKGIGLSHDSLAWSEVQAVLARGDEELAAVLVSLKSASISGWLRALKESGVDATDYTYRAREVGERLPWDILDSGTARGTLAAELSRALSQVSS